MKITKFTVVSLLTALLMVGCGEGKLPVDNGGNVEVSDRGFLAISNLSIDCRIDENDQENSGFDTYSTRSSVDVNNFFCEIINDKNEVKVSFKYGERPTEAIELEAGDYIFKIQSGEVPGAAWDTPVYGTAKPFKIVRNETTSLSEIVCSLMQIKVSVSYAPDLLERLDAETNTTVTIGTNSLLYLLTESRAGFFSAPEVSNTIELRIVGKYAADKVNYKPIEMTKEVRDVKVGQYSKIHFYIEQSNEGNLKVGVTIRDWVTDEIVPCNVADQVSEEEWIENGDDNGGQTPAKDPSIVWDGYDISKRYSLDTVTAVDLLINASNGISSFLVQIKSETLTPSELANVGLCDVLNLCYPTKSYDSNNPGTDIDVEQPLRDLGFAVGNDIIGKNSVTLSITQFLGILRTVSMDGHRHDFVLTVTDAKGNKSVETLKLQTGEVTEEEVTDGPSIVWVGHDISQREQIVAGLSVDLLIEAASGIKSFLVQIKSETLTPSELATAGLCDVLNLCYPTKSYDSNNPGTDVDVEQPLRDLGFAVGSDVLGKQSVTLSITQFMGILQSVSGSDLKRHDFVLTVTDNNDNTTVQTLMLQTGK